MRVTGKLYPAGALLTFQLISDMQVNKGFADSPAVAVYKADPSSIIGKTARIGYGTRIWHFCHIMDGAVIGDHCNIGQNVVVSPGVILGNNVKVQNNVSIYTGVTCEDDVFIGPSVVFTNVINPRSAINRKNEFQPTYVRKGASIGANATIVCGKEIGAYSFIGAGAVVTKDVAPYSLVTGNPARHTGWVSEYGHRLQFKEGKACCIESGQEYMLDHNNNQITKL